MRWLFPILTANDLSSCVSVCTEGGSMELFRKAIEGNEDKLEKQIEVEANGLWTGLLAQGVLTEGQIQICQSQV